MSPVTTIRSTLQILVAPQATFDLLRQHPAVGTRLLWMGVMAATLLWLQSVLVETALKESIPGGRHDGAGAPGWLLWIRLFMILVTPLGMALRAMALGSILHTLQSAAGGTGRWESCLSLAVCLESVFLVESSCTLVLLAIVRPEDLSTLQQLQLRAGLDLFWLPSSSFLRSLTSAMNLFVLWWGILLAEGTARLTGLSRTRAALLTLPLWLISLSLRVLLQPR
jgi:hypothetical protein